MMTTDRPDTVHEGHNVKRIREILGIKQDALAIELGEDWTQKKISLLEAKETIEPEILSQVAKALKVPVDSIKNFNEDATVSIIANTFNSNDNSTLNAVNYHCTFNPIDKIVQLYEEKVALYERMIKEKNELLDKLAKKK
jgi:transcriptional regulator with XRE-family HTH domain